MAGFIGFVTLGDTIVDGILAVNSSGTPNNADNVPTFHVYSGSSRLISGTSSAYHTFTVQNVTNDTQLLITTTAAHGLATGQRVTVKDVTGTGNITDANGTFTITVVTTTTFRLDGTTYSSGTYSSGGTGFVTGFYKASIACTTGNGFAASEIYRVVYNYAVSASARSETHEFMVS